MSRVRVISALTVASLVCVWVRPLLGQAPRSYQPYQSSQPTLSPWLQLNRVDPGQVLPSFQTFVQPRFQARQLQQQQQTNVQSLQQGLRQVTETQRQQMQPGGTIPTGVGAGFRMNARFFGTHPQYFQSHRPRR